MVLSTVCQSVCPSHYWGFPYIYRQIADQIELKFSGWTHYRTLRPDQVLVMLCWIPTVSWPLVEEFLGICWQSADNLQSDCWICWVNSIHVWDSPGLIKFWDAPLNSCSFLAFDWLGWFCSFTNKPLMRLNWNLADDKPLSQQILTKICDVIYGISRPQIMLSLCPLWCR